MTSSWMSVESTSMTTSRPPRRASPAGATAMSAPVAAETEREGGPQAREVGARDVELDGRHGPARQAADAVDVGPVLGDRPGDGRDVPGLQR